MSGPVIRTHIRLLLFPALPGFLPTRSRLAPDRFVSAQLRAAIKERVRNAPAEIDMLNWMGRTALELIGQAGLGYSFDPLEEDVTPDVYAEAIKSYVSVTSPFFAVFSSLTKKGVNGC